MHSLIILHTIVLSNSKHFVIMMCNDGAVKKSKYIVRQAVSNTSLLLFYTMCSRLNLSSEKLSATLNVSKTTKNTIKNALTLSRY